MREIFFDRSALGGGGGGGVLVDGITVRENFGGFNGLEHKRKDKTS